MNSRFSKFGLLPALWATSALMLLVLQMSLCAADPLDQWHCRNPYPTSEDIFSMIYANGHFMAVGSGGVVLTSSEGTNWTTRSCGHVANLMGISYGNETHVTVGWYKKLVANVDTLFPIILTSLDGISWIERTLADVHVKWLNSITYGNGMFVAVGSGGSILTSPDGIQWTAQSSGIGYELIMVGYGNGLFVAAGRDPSSTAHILTSGDGIHWNVVDAGVRTTLFQGVGFGNGTFLAVGSGALLLTSTDGQTWINRYSQMGGTLNAVCNNQSIYVAVGWEQGGKALILSSPDAHIWTQCSSGNAVGLRGIAYGADLFVSLNRATMLLSSNGFNWINLGSGVATSLGDVIYQNGQFVAVGDGGSVLRSPNGVQWQSGSSGITNYLARLAWGRGVFVAAGEQGSLISSTNSIDWVQRESGCIADFRGLCYAHGEFVAVAIDGSIVTSPDGVQWTVQPVIGANYVLGVTFGQDIFVAVGNDIFTSPDGTNWTSLGINLQTTLVDVGYGNGQFIAVSRGTIMNSSDGFNWSASALGEDISELDRIYFAHGIYMVVGQHGMILTSTNGVDWTKRISETGSYLRGVAFGNQTFLTVGDQGIILQSDPLPAWYLNLKPVPGWKDGTFGLTATGPTNCIWEIQASTNFTDWLPIMSVVSTNVSIPFIDAHATNYNRQFYRGQWW